MAIKPVPAGGDPPARPHCGADYMNGRRDNKKGREQGYICEGPERRRFIFSHGFERMRRPSDMMARAARPYPWRAKGRAHTWFQATTHGPERDHASRDGWDERMRPGQGDDVDAERGNGRDGAAAATVGQKQKGRPRGGLLAPPENVRNRQVAGFERCAQPRTIPRAG